ncbi:hypothetical protein M0811_01702 [Anaeramoeba ignava]|uniref:Regulator of chromosome condensation n=1 Tax=Anaeramoeba ignava TaxID=1746090 RepID=A0A9Q0R8H4_ANAIG|nr:hypothetical protein M0811_01702 [Anaeramoeba ignava]
MSLRNYVWFFGQNRNGFLIEDVTEIIKKPIQLSISDSDTSLIKISSGKFSTIFLFENGEANEYLNYSKQNKKIQIENIQKVSISSENEAVLTKEGKVFGKGKEINPQNSNQFTNISEEIHDTNDRMIENVVSSRSSIYLLSSSRNLYIMNLVPYIPTQNLSVIEIKRTLLLRMENVSKIFSGNSSKFYFVLNSNQELFGCGDNECGQLGSRRKKIHALDPIQNIPKGKILDIKCGTFHSIMLIEDEDENPKRKLYSSGHFQYNGLGEDENTYEFTEIKSSLFENENIARFAVGNTHNLILTVKNKLFVFGGNYYGQLGNGDTKDQSIPIQIELPTFISTNSITKFHISCGEYNSFIYFSWLTNLQYDLIKLFKRKEFCDISFNTINPNKKIEAHKLILKYRLKDQNQIAKLQEIISKKSIQESYQIFGMIYSNNSKINPKLYSEIKEIINSNEKIEETMKRIYLNENEKDFIIERKEKKYKFPKLILIMRSELYRGMFLSVINDKSNKVTDYSELKDIQITQEIIDEIQRAIDYFQLNQTNPNLLDLVKEEFKRQIKK